MPLLLNHAQPRCLIETFELNSAKTFASTVVQPSWYLLVQSRQWKQTKHKTSANLIIKTSRNTNIFIQC